MATLFLLTGLALAIFALALGALVWSVRSGQYDDLDTPGVRVLVDDATAAPPSTAIPSTDRTHP
jgi:cbb3-type cytochrome oxidase maturation protein